MSISDPFIRRPVGTTLLTVAIALAGTLGYLMLPVSPVPQVDSPYISVGASLPGASPETMASAVATPLERQFGRIAGVTDMTSTSYLGTTNINLEFALDRDIDAAARDVQAAINAARGQLPSYLPGNPSYRKVNPADAPVLILAISSELYGKARMYDAASTILAQKLSQVKGVGQVTVGGGALPAVRVDVNPMQLNQLGLGLEDVRTALANANANRPKGEIADGQRSWSLATTDQLLKADEYRPLIIAHHNGAAVRLGDIATVSDGVEDVRNSGAANGRPAILLIVSRQPGANIIELVDRLREMLPQLQAEIPAAMALSVVMDRTTTIRASVRDVQLTLLLSIALVILVVFLFLRDWRTTLIPSVAVPVSLLGTFAVMYLCGYSIDNLSLMALTIATGFVVDDAIVVIENITRHIEDGMSPYQATLRGAREIGFTVVSMSTSLVAVFIPLLLMGGLVGRLFREFAVTLSVAIGISLIVSLTTTPMMCAALLKGKGEHAHGRLYRASERGFDWVLGLYTRSLSWVLRHSFATLVVTVATVAVTVWLYIAVPKGFFPQQDTGRIGGSVRADQDSSSQAVSRLVARFASIVSEDPAVADVISFTGSQGGTSNTGRFFVTLKPLAERKVSADEVINRLRGKLAVIPGAALILQTYQELRVGGRQSPGQYQYTLQGDDLAELSNWSVKLADKLRTLPGVADVSNDFQDRGLQAGLVFDRPTAARLGITPQAIDATLYDAFGQRQVSTMYRQLNQYHVVMEMEPALWQDPRGLEHVRVRAGGGALVPLPAIARYAPSTTSLSVAHQGQFPAVTLSFNLLPGASLGDATDRIKQAELDIGLPVTIQGTFSGTAAAYRSSSSSQPLLILAAVLAVYIVLGMLYESLIHPITIISTIPSAGVGALLALLLFKTELSIMALIGIILLIGIVKKNAIMMVDFAVDVERREGRDPRDAIFEACRLRFRPILMTTLAALFGCLPLAFSHGVGFELRQPVGIAIGGGLIFSQILTLYTTPVVYLYLDRLQLRIKRTFVREMQPAEASSPVTSGESPAAGSR